MLVISEWKTVDRIINTQVGIARYGDGEIKLICNQNIKSQRADSKLSERLKEILIKENQKCIVGIPNIYDGVLAPEGTKAHTFWTRMRTRPEYYAYMDKNKRYYSSFITRPDNTKGIDNIEYFEHCKKMWDGRDVVIVTGEDIAFCKREEILDNCNVIKTITGPPVNAWFQYDSILKQCLDFPEDTLYLLRLGPTATVLAWDLGLQNRQGLDLGHFGMFVNRVYNKSTEIDYDNSKRG